MVFCNTHKQTHTHTHIQNMTYKCGKLMFVQWYSVTHTHSRTHTNKDKHTHTHNHTHTEYDRQMG